MCEIVSAKPSLRVLQCVDPSVGFRRTAQSRIRASKAGVSRLGPCPAWRLNSPANRSRPNRLLQRSINPSLQSSLSRICAQVWPASSSSISRARRPSSARPLRLLRPVQNRPFDKHGSLFQIPWRTNIQNDRRITPVEQPGYESPPEISGPSCQKHLHGFLYLDRERVSVRRAEVLRDIAARRPDNLFTRCDGADVRAKSLNDIDTSLTTPQRQRKKLVYIQPEKLRSGLHLSRAHPWSHKLGPARGLDASWDHDRTACATDRNGFAAVAPAFVAEAQLGAERGFAAGQLLRPTRARAEAGSSGRAGG
jgi:hypothetical protein